MIKSIDMCKSAECAEGKGSRLQAQNPAFQTLHLL